MAWTTPQTWVTGQLVTASDMNTDVRDNMNYLHTAKGVRAYHSAAQSIGNAAWTTLAFNSERYDTDAYHDTVTNNSRITIPSTALNGKYSIKANVEFATNSGGKERGLRILLGGTTVIGKDHTNISNNLPLPGISVAIDYILSSGQYIEAQVYQDSGGALNLNSTSNNSPEFSVHWIGS